MGGFKIRWMGEPLRMREGLIGKGGEGRAWVPNPIFFDSFRSPEPVRLIKAEPANLWQPGFLWQATPVMSDTVRDGADPTFLDPSFPQGTILDLLPEQRATRMGQGAITFVGQARPGLPLLAGVSLYVSDAPAAPEPSVPGLDPLPWRRSMLNVALGLTEEMRASFPVQPAWWARRLNDLGAGSRGRFNSMGFISDNADYRKAARELRIELAALGMLCDAIQEKENRLVDRENPPTDAEKTKLREELVPLYRELREGLARNRPLVEDWVRFHQGSVAAKETTERMGTLFVSDLSRYWSGVKFEVAVREEQRKGGLPWEEARTVVVNRMGFDPAEYPRQLPMTVKGVDPVFGSSYVPNPEGSGAYGLKITVPNHERPRIPEFLETMRKKIERERTDPKSDWFGITPSIEGDRLVLTKDAELPGFPKPEEKYPTTLRLFISFETEGTP